MEDSFPQPDSLRSPSVAGGSWDGTPGRSLGRDPSSRQQMKWIAEARSCRCSLSGRAVITPVGFPKVVSLPSQCEELCSEVLCGARCWNFRGGCLQILQKMDSWVSSILRWHPSPKSLGFPLEIFVGHEQEGCWDYYPERGGFLNGNTKHCLMQWLLTWPPALRRQ